MQRTLKVRCTWFWSAGAAAVKIRFIRQRGEWFLDKKIHPLISANLHELKFVGCG